MKSFLSKFRTLRAKPPRPAGDEQPVQAQAPTAAAPRDAARAVVCASARHLAAAGVAVCREHLEVWISQLMAAERQEVAAKRAELERAREEARFRLQVLESTVPPTFSDSDREMTHA